MPNDPFLSLFLYFWPFLIILVVIGIMIRVVIFFAFAWTAMKQINQFQRQLDGIVLNLPPPGSYPSHQWIGEATTLATTWNQLAPIQQARLENRKADIMATFTSAGVPFTPPSGWR
ncbi:hypothetical protein IVB18_08950 [Bradyrhizobium sp. 186]|uniref:hypothetical protein n=1 Tax=Bradyrhizobium sp. 186 TaxID=2782654 RepID=UPI002000E3A4|nr:hypothetical protein [Bradyrhizobium sp. 186]UPK37407.1 hypothetical protein IVB18_08950 [Bradyrhizobium sp. 186]